MRRPRGEKGFTLIEISVVVGLIAILALLAFPNLGALTGTRELAGFANRLAGTLDYTRARAILDGRLYYFHLDRDARRYWATRMGPEGAEEPAPGRLGRPVPFPDGVRLSGILKSPLRFYPGGNSDEATVELRREGSYGTRYIIEVKPYVGRSVIQIKG